MQNHSETISLKNQCVDINDVFEDIAFSEQKIIREGFREGLRKGIEEGKEEGYHLGFHRGLEFGYELGYYEGAVSYLLQSHETGSILIPEKVFSILSKLKFLITSYPRINCSNTDILQSRDAIKSLFRRLCSLLKFDGLVAEKGVSF